MSSSGTGSVSALVTGGTGVIGNPLVSLLRSRGYDVTVLTRRQAHGKVLSGSGVKACVGDLADVEGVRRLLISAKPNVLFHCATALAWVPSRFCARKLTPALRIWKTGTEGIVSAAVEAGVQRIVAVSSILVYPASKEAATEETPCGVSARGTFGRVVRALLEMEDWVRGAGDGNIGVVLRCGWLYGEGTFFSADGRCADLLRQRRFPILGKGEGIASFLHVEDAARAVFAAGEAPADVYNIVDDDPVASAEWVPFVADLLRADSPRQHPLWVYKPTRSPLFSHVMTRQPSVSNELARRRMKWVPVRSSWRDGFAEIWPKK